MKQLMDISLSIFLLTILLPVIAATILLIWLSDFHSPFYIAQRVGLNEMPFSMYKLRTMIINADKTGVDSTSSDDQRITYIGKYVRRFKLDEFLQLFNVLKGEMSLVGPRPNVIREVNLYTKEEKRLLSIKPGITDISSIVFADEGDILAGYSDPDIAYHQLVRPWKGRLGLFYIEHRNISMDIQLFILTLISMLSRRTALNYIEKLLKVYGAGDELILIASRKVKLRPTPPVGAMNIVTNRSGVVN